jgi:regulatory protein
MTANSQRRAVRPRAHGREAQPSRRQISAAPGKTSHPQAMNAAVRILTHRDHSKYELKQKLQQRGFTSEVIDTVILECERLNYVDDKRTAQIYISQLKRKRFGRRHVRMALKKKRLYGTAIENFLSENYTKIEEHKNADKLLQKKMKTFNREEDLQKRRDKIYRFLYSRGFNKDIIADLIRSHYFKI